MQTIGTLGFINQANAPPIWESIFSGSHSHRFEKVANPKVLQGEHIVDGSKKKSGGCTS